MKKGRQDRIAETLTAREGVKDRYFLHFFTEYIC